MSAAASTGPHFNVINGTIHVVDARSLPGIYERTNLWFEEIEKRCKDLRNWEQYSGGENFFRSILGGKKIPQDVYLHLYAIQLQQHQPTPSNVEDVKLLKVCPLSWEPRMRIVQRLNQSKQHLPLEAYRELLFQSMIPLAMGFYSNEVWKLFIRVYQNYLKHLETALQQKIRLVNSEDYELQEHQDKPGYLRQLSANLKSLKMLLMMTQQKEVQQVDIVPFFLSDFTNNQEVALALRQETGNEQVPLLSNTDEILGHFKKVASAMRFFPLLQPVMAKQVEHLQVNYPHDVGLYSALGRSYIQATQITLSRHNYGALYCLPIVKQYLRKGLEYYGRGKRLIEGSNLTKEALTLLRLQSIAALSVFQARETLKVPFSVISNILTVGKSNLERLQEPTPDDIRLYTKLKNAEDVLNGRNPTPIRVPA